MIDARVLQAELPAGLRQTIISVLHEAFTRSGQWMEFLADGQTEEGTVSAHFCHSENSNRLVFGRNQPGHQLS